MEKSSDELAPGMFFKPEDIGTWNSFKRFLYNSEDGTTVFGRTGLSWAKIGLFYLVSYGVLAGMLAAMLMVFFQTLDPFIPKLQVEASIIGTPGLGFLPMPSDANVDNTLIWYRGRNREDSKNWPDKLYKFLEVYRTPGLTPGRGQNIVYCDYDHMPRPGQVCDEDVKNWHPCTSENDYGYHRHTPCIFLKLNKIDGWIPEYYNDTKTLPDQMPNELKNYIHNEKTNHPRKLNNVWVSCEGENPADVENVGRINYIPRRGFPGYFYPFKNSEGYLSPLVAIHFERPKTGILINIECKAWAKNIIHDRTNRIGSVHFELLIDN